MYEGMQKEKSLFRVSGILKFSVCDDIRMR